MIVAIVILSVLLLGAVAFIFLAIAGTEKYF